MIRALVIRARAEAQAATARDWYDEQLTGLGDEFLVELDLAVSKAHLNPLHYQKVVHEMRRALLRRFPFAVFYVVEEERVVILAVLRQSSDPATWDDS